MDIVKARARLRRWSGWVHVRDAVLVAIALLAGWQGLQDSGSTPGPAWLAGLAMLPGIVALPWRRAHPSAVFTVAAVPNLLSWLVLGAPENGGMLLSMVVVLYSVGRWEDLRRRANLVMLLAVPLLVIHEWRDPSNTDLLQLLKALPYDAVGVAAWLMGAFIRVRREQRVTAAAQIAAAERTRIARELHDIVAHGIGVMVVQAEGAAEVIQRDPDRARAAMERVADTGRASLVELRRALGMLRGDSPADGAPQPGLSHLDELVHALGGTGLRIHVRSTGTATRLSPGVDLALYRVVQEALTNTLRHAEARTATVEIEHVVGAVRLRVTDDGCAGSTEQTTGGRGLLGIRERIGMLGGHVETGPITGGGFRVAVSVPTGAGQ
ncbi:MAG TPA: sensor histidine kinase [Marmoricola sp.]